MEQALNSRLMPWKNELRESLSLAIPLSTIQLAEAAVSFVDTLMMGWLGSQTLAAGGLGAVVMLTTVSICMGMVEGIGALSAEAFAQNDNPRVGKITAQALWICVVVSLVAMPLLWQVGALLPLLGQTPQNSALAADYLHAVVWSFPAALGLAVFKEVGAVLGQAKWITIITIATVPLNAIVNYGLAFGHFGLPALGLAGLGWASSLVFWLSFSLTVAIFLLQPSLKEQQVFKYIGQFDRTTNDDIVKLGWPLMVQYGAEYILFTAAALFMGYWGTTELAAYELVISGVNVVIMIPWGISHAAAIRVAQNIGQQDTAGATRAVGVNSALALCSAVLIMLMILRFPDQIAALYLDSQDLQNTELLHLARSFFTMAAIFQSIYAMHLVGIGALQGLLDSRWPMLSNSICYWGIGIGGGYLLGEMFHWHGLGVWWSLILGVLVANILLLIRFTWLLTNRYTDSTVDRQPEEATA